MTEQDKPTGRIGRLGAVAAMATLLAAPMHGLVPCGMSGNLLIVAAVLSTVAVVLALFARMRDVLMVVLAGLVLNALCAH